MRRIQSITNTLYCEAKKGREENRDKKDEG